MKLIDEMSIESEHIDGVVRQLSVDLKERYPKMGLLSRQFWNMKKFYLRYAGHDEATLFYAKEVSEKGWNRDLLLNAIKLNLYESQLATMVDNNFSRTLPMDQAKYVNEVFGSNYEIGKFGEEKDGKALHVF